MKKLLKAGLVIIIACAIGGVIYWQSNKKNIIKNSIEKAIFKKTDSLYYIHYDSSHIDEINGNASFYNVALQSDTAQKALLTSTDSLPNALYNVHVGQVSANGVDLAGLLQKQHVGARKIILLKPVIQIINTGADNPKPFTVNDTLALYRKILGKFKSIKADTIQVTDGILILTNKAGKAKTTLENINITLSNFLVDSTKNYNNIISYFIKDVRATVAAVRLNAKNNTSVTLEKVDYNAAGKSLLISSIKQYRDNSIVPVIDLKNIRVNDLNTDAFVLQQQLKAGQISCDGGLITIYVKKKPGKAKAGDQSLELSTDIIDQAQIGGINLGGTKISIVNKDEPGKAPFVLNNTRFKVTKMLKIGEGATINNLINNAEWQLSADGFSIITKSKLYKMSVGDFIINNATSTVQVKNFLLVPAVTDKQFAMQVPYQHDQYNLNISDIKLSGVNIKKLINSKEFEVANASFKPVVRIFDDRTQPSNGKSKVGNYPHQQILKLQFPIYIRNAKINNGLVSYREKGIKSALIGDVFFSGINATLSNITNMPDRIKADPIFKLTAAAKFLGSGSATTEWQFPLNTSDGAFSIKGRMKQMSALNLNPIIEPLALASIKSGTIDEMSFTMEGSDTKATANVLFLYHDLKMELLKKGEDEELKKKGLLTLFANLLIKNANTSTVNSKSVTNERDKTRSFFNLVWKTIYKGAKKTATGKKTNNEEE